MTATSDVEWLLFIYTLPSQPSRKRAYVWRELKKLGASYLRDGVAILPLRADLQVHLEEMVHRVQEYEGSADLIIAPRFAGGRSAELVERFREERTAEYREAYHACVRFLRDVLHEVDREDFAFPDVDNLESELARLWRWYYQIRERDYFGADGGGRTEEILHKCDRAFERFVSTASELEEAEKEKAEDIFERLGGRATAEEPVPEDYPL